MALTLGALLVAPAGAAAKSRDRDRDGLTTRQEKRYGTNPRRADTDRDGLKDGYEVRRSHTNPRRRDTDRDRLGDGYELRTVHTSPLRADTDLDRLSDYYELRKSKTHPRKRDTDGDLLTDGFEVRVSKTNPKRADTDGDGYTDFVELLIGSNPFSRRSPTRSSAPARDRTPPETTITSGPLGSISANTASFGFVSSEPGSTFQCRLDSGHWGSCVSPRAYSLLALGPHTFYVRARDAAGNLDKTPASRLWTVISLLPPPDTTPPDTTIDSGPSGTVSTGDASFGFSSSEAGSTFACRLDGGAWAGCSSPKAYTALPNGSHTFEVRATDAAGNVDLTPATRTWTVNVPPPPDTTPPDTTITSGPSGTVATGDASLGFSSSETGSSFECRLDGAAWASCSSPRAYTALSNGSHTFDVRATDAAGNVDLTPATRTWTVNVPPPPDTTPPDTTIDSGPSGTVSTGDASFAFSSSEAGSTFECRLDGAAWAGCSSPKAYTNIANGTHAFEVRAIDAAGNVDASPASQIWIVSVPPPADTTPPTVALTAPSSGAKVSGTVTVAAGASDASGVAGVQFKLDGANAGGEDTAAPYSLPWNTTTSSDGAHTLTAVARDSAGNTATSAPVGVTVENGAVAAYSFNEGGGANAGDTSGFGNTGALSGATWTSAGRFGGALTFDGVNDWVTVADSPSLDLTDGMTLEAWVKPTDTTGWRTALLKEAGTDLAYALYAEAPQPGPAAVPGSWVGQSFVTGPAVLPAGQWSHLTTTYDRATWKLYVNGVEVASKPQTAAIPTSSGPLRVGGNSVWPEFFQGTIDEVRVYDHALSSLEVARDRDVGVAGGAPPDTTPPDTTLSSGPSGTVTTGDTSFGFSSTETGSSFECRLDGAAWGACSSPKSYTSLANGSHTFDVRATDVAGNVDASPASRTWTVNAPAPPPDTTPPDTTITSGPSGTVSTGDASFGFSSSEAGSSFECRLDGAAWGACSSPKSYTSLGNGSHNFDVRATDVAGNVDATPATRSWTVDVLPPSGSCTVNATTSTFASVFANAGTSSVICLASGSYGTFSGALKAGLVTIRPQTGATASMALNFNPASNITVDGLTITGADLSDSRTKNITVRNSDIPGQVIFRTGYLANANILFDNNVHHDWNKCSGCAEARVWFPDNTSQPSGITVQNSEFRGGLSDGIQNGSNGTRILNNNFHDLNSGSADGVHADAIQLYGSKNTVIRGNYFHDLGHGIGLIMAPDGADHEVIENNVFDPLPPGASDQTRPFALDLGSDNGSIVRHNTFADGQCEFNLRCGIIDLGAKSGMPLGHGTIIKDNIVGEISVTGGSTYAESSYNLCRASCPGTANLTGLPTYIGGSNPTSFAGFKLASGSLGAGSASDGTDRGAPIP